MFAGLFTAAAHVSLLPLMLLTSLNPWGEHNVMLRLLAWAIASLTASAFAILTITAVVGVLVFALSRSQMQALSTFMRSIVLGLLVVCLPLVSHLPTLGGPLVEPRALDHARAARLVSRRSTHAPGQRGCVARSTRPHRPGRHSSDRRHRGRHLHRPVQAIRAADASAGADVGAMVATRSTRHALRSRAAFRGVYRFTIATIGRSQLHQGVLVGLSACGVGLATIILTSASVMTSALFVPFVLMFACGVGARAALALPIEYRANWIFQVTEDQTTRREQLRAVDRVVTTYVIGVPLTAAVPLLWMALGPGALLAAAVVAAVGLVFVHIVLLDWRRIPFTCSYLPGKRFIGHSALIGVASCLLFTVTGGGFVRAAMTDTTRGIVIAGALLVIGYGLRERRLVTWKKTPLMFEDEFPDQPLQLQL